MSLKKVGNNSLSRSDLAHKAATMPVDLGLSVDNELRIDLILEPVGETVVSS